MRHILFLSFGVLMAVSPGTNLTADTCDSAANLVANCGFETGDLSGWQTSPTGFDGVWYGVSNSDAYTGNYGAFLAGFGSFAASDNNYAILAQSLATTPGSSYALNFHLAHFVPDSPPPTPDNAILFAVDSTLLGDEVNVGNQNWTSVTRVFTATSTSSLLQFVAEDANYQFSLDDISVTRYVVPEPATFFLAFAPILLLYIAGRRRQHPDS